MKKLEFNSMSTSEFNSIFETKIEKGMTWWQVLDEIEREETEYFYASMDRQDVIDAIESEDSLLIEQLHLWLIYIEQVGFFIAIKQ